MEERRPPSISLVMPTFNRAEFLKKALDSVAAAAVQYTAKIEVIVVDNNSNDNTVEIIKEAAANFPCVLRYVKEMNQGSSHARNRGSKEAQGYYIVFMDDDQIMDSNYFNYIPEAFETTGAACVGGPVTYYNALNLPRWLQELSTTIGQISYGDQIKILGPDTHKGLGAGNMVFVKSELIAAGAFNVRLGRFGNDLMTGEDFELQDRLRAMGKTVAYHPQLIQYHYLRPERFKKGYWREYYHTYGRAVAIRRSLESSEDGKRLFHAPVWLWRSLLTRDLPAYVVSLFTFDFVKIFRRELAIWTRVGEIQQSRSGHATKQNQSTHQQR